MKIKPLDFVSPVDKPERIGIITEISSSTVSDNTQYLQASVSWIGGEKGLYSAWWGEKELVVIDNLPLLLSKRMAHPFSSQGKTYAEKAFKNQDL